MEGYGQYCPIALGAEIFAERWTPIILRNLMVGSDRFGDLLAGAPGIPRSVLARRLRTLEREGVINRFDGRPPTYRLTDSGLELAPVVRKSVTIESSDASIRRVGIICGLRIEALTPGVPLVLRRLEFYLCRSGCCTDRPGIFGSVVDGTPRSIWRSTSASVAVVKDGWLRLWFPARCPLSSITSRF